MAADDYEIALRNGIDAARSGSRMMARLHLLKAADFAPDAVAAHLWLAWVAETPADALAHLEDALSRNPRHALTRVGRLWAKLMAEFDPAADYADVELGDLAPSPPASAAPVEATSAKTIRFSTTQRLSELAEAPAGASDDADAKPAQPKPALGRTNARHPASPAAEEPPLDLRRTARIDLVQRERPEDAAQDPSLAETCLFSASSKESPAGDATERSPSSGAVPTMTSLVDQPAGSGTIPIDPQAVKRALAESVIAEMTEPDRSRQSAMQSESAAATHDDIGGSAAGPVGAPCAAASLGATPHPSSRIDAYTEPPQPALSPDAVETAAASINPPSSGPRVLVVDDSPTVRKFVSSTLESRGYRVAGVASGYEAIEVLSQTIPDALVIEVDLPRLDGLHLCKLLRTQEATRETPVIFLTRRNGTMDRMRGKMVGATAYLTKPFRSAALLEELATCCPIESA